MSILIKKVWYHNKRVDVLIKDNKIASIKENIILPADNVIAGTNKVVLPGLINGHTHAAMTLFRGYADDWPLQAWLEKKIWPREAKLTEEDVYVGAKLACLEMIKTGTTFFSDMYWHLPGSARAVAEMGLRAALSAVFIDIAGARQAEEQIKLNQELFKKYKDFNSRIIFTLGPHTIYTVSKQSLAWIRDFARENNLLIHIHVSETEAEVKKTVKVPVIVGSGIKTSNIKEQMGIADGAIVGSSLKIDGVASNPVDKNKVIELMGELK